MTGPPARAGGFPSLDRVLDEARFMFQLEDSRHDALQQKAATVMGTAGIITALLTIPNQFSDIQIAWLVGVFLASILAGLGVIALRRYKVPHADVNQFFGLARKKPIDLADQFLLDYIGAVDHNRRANEAKLWFLRFAIMFLAVGMTLVSIFFAVNQLMS